MTTTALFTDGVRWTEMKRTKRKSHLWPRGIVRRVGGTKAAPVVLPAEADAQVFWADSEAQAAFGARHRVYIGVAAAVNHEANSENTFSFAGRAFSKFRTELASGQQCDTVVAVAGEKREATTPLLVQRTYKNCGGNQRLWARLLLRRRPLRRRRRLPRRLLLLLLRRRLLLLLSLWPTSERL